MAEQTCKPAMNPALHRRRLGSRLAACVAALAAGLVLAACHGANPRSSEKNQPSMQPFFTFGALADAQYADHDPWNTRYYRASLGKLTACVNEFNRRDLTFVIDLGDLIDRDAASFAPALKALAPLRAPLYHVAGNHDLAAGRPEEAARALGLARRYYDFARSGWRFVVLDGNDLSLYATTAGSPEHAAAEAMLDDLRRRGAPNAQEWNGGIGPAQLDWLRATLARARAVGERVVVFCHFPVWPDNVHNLWNAEAALDALDSSPGVVAWIAGHNHEGNYGLRRGVHHLTLRGMVETPDRGAYALVEVWPDRLRVIGRDGEPDRTLPFSPLAPTS
ncbi:MAG: metallophosphoesterase [bacterium]|nr:metallophosphoesterase [bacterium]